MPFEPVRMAIVTKNLYLEKIHVCNSVGSINEEGWEEFKNFVSKGMPAEKIRVSKSKMESYLDHCLIGDLARLEKGINAYALFASPNKEIIEAKSAWAEVYRQLACGWIPNESGDDLEPYIDLNLIRLIVEDSRGVSLIASRDMLPIAKLAVAFVPTVGFRR